MSAPEEMVEEFGMVDAGAGEEGLFGRKKNVGPPPFYFFFMSLLGWFLHGVIPPSHPLTSHPSPHFVVWSRRRSERLAVCFRVAPVRRSPPATFLV